MAASTAHSGQSAGRDMGFEEAEIKRKMSEIADWLKAQSEPAQPAAPKLQVITSQAPAPVVEERNAEPSTLESIAEARAAASRERERALSIQDTNSGSLREVMDRFSGPFHSQQAPEQPRALRAAVAEIQERQRSLGDVRPPASPPDMLGMELAFERLASKFEERAARTFETLESSFAEVSRLIHEARAPSAHTDEIQAQIQTLESQTSARVDEVARDLAMLRSEAADSERRTRELLDTVRLTLEHVAARLPDRQTAPVPQALAPQAAAPQAPAANPSERARAAALRAIEERAEQADAELAVPLDAAPERRRYIAAARRSAQPAEPTAKYRALGAAPKSRPTPAQASVSTMKRTLLAGAAAAALLFGIYAGSSRFLEGLFSDTRTSEVTQEQSAPAQQSFVPPEPTPAVVENRTTTESITAESPPATAANMPPMVFEPTMTGSIPEAAAPEPLPMEIGGPKLRTRAIAGDAAAQYEVAMRFAEGRGVARDPEKAVVWMARAAAQGLAPAQYRFANLTEKGIGTAKDVSAARGMYEQAAAAGNVQAMHNLGVIYAEGGLGQPDMAVASVWFRKAAEYGVKDSQYNLAILYARGISVPQDLAESYLWFSLAAKQGDKDAGSKRDQVGAKLDAGKVSELRVRADTWKPKAAPVEANEVAAPSGGWDEPGKPV